jgi:hypothetical protein
LEIDVSDDWSTFEFAQRFKVLWDIGRKYLATYELFEPEKEDVPTEPEVIDFDSYGEEEENPAEVSRCLELKNLFKSQLKTDD